MLSVSGKNILSFGSMAARTLRKSSVVKFLIIPAQADKEVLSLNYQQGGELIWEIYWNQDIAC